MNMVTNKMHTLKEFERSLLSFGGHYHSSSFNDARLRI
jgi:hypothetical protein